MKDRFVCSFAPWLLLALSLVLEAHRVAAEPTGAKANLRILTWNIQMLPTAFDRFSESLQREQKLRAPWIIEYLNGQDYDIVVLQEVIDPAITESLKQGIKERYPYIVAPESKMRIAGASSGILFASKIPLASLPLASLPVASLPPLSDCRNTFAGRPSGHKRKGVPGTGRRDHQALQERGYAAVPDRRHEHEARNRQVPDTTEDRGNAGFSHR